MNTPEHLDSGEAVKKPVSRAERIRALLDDRVRGIADISFRQKQRNRNALPHLQMSRGMSIMNRIEETAAAWETLDPEFVGGIDGRASLAVEQDTVTAVVNMEDTEMKEATQEGITIALAAKQRAITVSRLIKRLVSEQGDLAMEFDDPAAEARVDAITAELDAIPEYAAGKERVKADEPINNVLKTL